MSRPRFYYGWVIAAVSFLTLFMALGISYSYGVFFVAIVEEYGWSRGATGDLFPGNSLGRILAIQSIGFGLAVFSIWMAAPRHVTPVD